MSDDVYFKASLQNTLNPEVGTFDNVGNKEGTFTLEDGEYYLTNNTRTSYGVYYPTKDIYSVGFTIEFDINYPGSSDFEWYLAFNGDDSTYWFGIGIWETSLEFRGQTLPNYHLITSPNKWLHVKCIFDYDYNQNYVNIYIDNVKVNNFVISKNYGIKYIDILGNSGGFVSKAKIKNIIIYKNEKHYLDTTGLTSLWSKIKSLLSPSAIRAQWYAAYPDGAEAHNAMWGGRDITAAFNAGTVSANIADGTFRDIFPGDYITKQVTIPQVLADDGTTKLFAGGTFTVNWVIADCDYWWNKGDTAMTAHHVAIVPQTLIFGARMNATNTTEGGYTGSEMYKNIIPACAKGIVNAFGSDHILTFRDYLTQDLNTSAVSSGITVFTGAPNWNGGWYSQQCNLMSEAMVYDGPHCASSALDNIMATRQMSAFRLSERLINYNRQAWWLRDVISSTFFAGVVGDGVFAFALDSDASHLHVGVRPFALLK